MKDSELRGRVLQFLYERRDEEVTFGSDGENIPLGADFTASDWFRVCHQLGEKDLINWAPHTYHNAGYERMLEGRARINAHGVDVIEGEVRPPIAVRVDQSQNIHISGSHGVQIAGANSNQQQTTTDAFEKVLTALTEAEVPENDKAETRSLLLKVLDSKAAAAVLGAGATYLADKLAGEK